MNTRSAQITRKTNETDIDIRLALDGAGSSTLMIPTGFLSHMLTAFTKNARFDLNITATGDMNVDDHHTVEDIGIVLGQAIGTALADKKGITRYGFFILPMDEALATVAIDFSGRYAFRFDCAFTRERIGDLSSELVYDFWDAFAQNARANVYIKVENGRNDHHKAEAIFKAMGRACRMAVAKDSESRGEIPSTKGSL